MIAQELRQGKRYRTELTVVTQLLQIIKQKGNGIILTNLLTTLQCDHDRILKLLDKMITCGIISKEIAMRTRYQDKRTKGRSLYKLTQKGYVFLNELENFYTMLKQYNLEITL